MTQQYWLLLTQAELDALAGWIILDSVMEKIKDVQEPTEAILQRNAQKPVQLRKESASKTKAI